MKPSAEGLDVLAEWETSDSPEKKTKTAAVNKRKNVDAHMARRLLNGDKECQGWSCKQWATELGCSTAAVVKTKTWERLEEVREP